MTQLCRLAYVCQQSKIVVVQLHMTNDSAGRVSRPVIPFAFGFPELLGGIQSVNTIVTFPYAFVNDGNHYGFHI